MEQGLRIAILRDKEYSLPEGYKHKYGGDPTFAAALPHCEVCQRPLKLVFQFDLSDPQLRFLKLPKLPYLPVLSCVDCDLATAGDLLYRVHADGIEVLQSDAVVSIGHWDTACPERNISMTPVPPEHCPSHHESVEAWRDSMERSELPKHQLGGTPFWVQEKRETVCPECSSPMRFLGQVDSETWAVPGWKMLAGHMFGDMGMLYIHYCDDCNVLGTGGDAY